MGRLTIKIIIIVGLLQITTIPLITAQEARNISDETTNSQNVVTIDLTQCVCSADSNCDLTIIKSSLMEVTCGEEETFCCPMTRSTENTSPVTTVNTTEENEPAPKPSPVTNVRIYTINHLNPELAARSSFMETETTKAKVKKNCRCKSRSSCPHKYIDYGFGFHCSYSTVRCCIPEDDTSLENEESPSPLNATMEVETTLAEAQQEINAAIDTVQVADSTYQLDNLPSTELEVEDMGEPETIPEQKDMSMPISPQNTEGGLLITEVTSWRDNDSDYMKESECFCLPIQNCRASLYTQNSIERRRDTLCPSDLIQCCGFDVVEEITKKKDDINTEYSATPTQQDLPPFQQPVQLPEFDMEETKVTNEAPPMHYTEEVPPPSLPTQYQNYDQTGYDNGYNYPANTYPSMLSGPQSYPNSMYGTREQNIGPWVSLSSPSSYAKYGPMQRNPNQGYPRGPYQENGYAKAPKSGGLLDTFKQFLG